MLKYSVVAMLMLTGVETITKYECGIASCDTEFTSSLITNHHLVHTLLGRTYTHTDITS